MKRWLLSFLCLLAVSNAAANSAFVYLFDVMRQPDYQSAWEAMVKNESLPSWVEQMTHGKNKYVSNPVIPITIQNISYECFQICKPHNCGWEHMYILFAPHAAQAWSFLTEENGKSRWLGNPDDMLKKALENCGNS